MIFWNFFCVANIAKYHHKFIQIFGLDFCVQNLSQKFAKNHEKIALQTSILFFLLDDDAFFKCIFTK
jgi:hypothetical protein